MLFPRVLSLVAMVAISGCAFGSRQVNLMYEPPASAAVSGSRGTIAVAVFTDSRSSDQAVGHQVGQVRNGYGIPTAQVNANQSPVIGVSDSLARGLAAQGFKVERVDSPRSAGAIAVVGGSVLEVFADMYWSIEANVKADVVVERNGERLFSTQCVGTEKQVTMAASADDYQDRLNGAMKKFVDSCVPKLLPALEAGP